MKKPIVLIIRDGWGISPAGPEAAQQEGNAPVLARTPFHDQLFATYPWATLSASGEDVGLPAGQMGNSEVGHLNLGAGRIVYQDITRIDKAIRDGTFFQNEVLGKAFARLRSDGKALHLLGLLSDGGVHSHQNHLYALIQMARDAGVANIFIHLVTDGRDTSPTGGVGYVRELQGKIRELGAGVPATLIGRYYAMDRDQRWDRTKAAYDLIVNGIGEKATDPVAALEGSYEAGVTDEFIKPHILVDTPRPLVRDGDVVVFFNFRSDRGRQLCRAWKEPGFNGFEVNPRPEIELITLTQYDARYTEWGVRTVFPPQSMDNILGQILSAAGKTQCRMAETEKYPHVTFFFNGGVEPPYLGEDREVVPSPKVATYDLQPEMSAPELTEKVLERLRSGRYDVIILNFANPDMVGHTGSLAAAIRAVETVDDCVRRVVETVMELGGIALVTADHGNCERMINPDGSPHTAHTTNLVHFAYVAADADAVKVRNGILADVAPTILALAGVEKPPEMTGRSLIERK
ncbi:MAG: 2,3-bisphosphoglycerate-independent phosphoglycerate mutase [Candidatus Methylacidiphilales bacterium]